MWLLHFTLGNIGNSQTSLSFSNCNLRLDLDEETILHNSKCKFIFSRKKKSCCTQWSRIHWHDLVANSSSMKEERQEVETNPLGLFLFFILTWLYFSLLSATIIFQSMEYFPTSFKLKTAQPIQLWIHRLLFFRFYSNRDTSLLQKIPQNMDTHAPPSRGGWVSCSTRGGGDLSSFH